MIKELTNAARMQPVVHLYRRLQVGHCVWGLQLHSDLEADTSTVPHSRPVIDGSLVQAKLLKVMMQLPAGS